MITINHNTQRLIQVNIDLAGNQNWFGFIVHLWLFYFVIQCQIIHTESMIPVNKSDWFLCNATFPYTCMEYKLEWSSYAWISLYLWSSDKRIIWVATFRLRTFLYSILSSATAKNIAYDIIGLWFSHKALQVSTKKRIPYDCSSWNRIVFFFSSSSLFQLSLGRLPV